MFLRFPKFLVFKANLIGHILTYFDDKILQKAYFHIIKIYSEIFRLNFVSLCNI